MPSPKRNNCSKRIILGILSLALMLVHTGCMPTELNERSLVSMVGIDQSDDGKIKLTLGLIGTQKSMANDRLTIYTTEGETLFDAGRRFIQIIGIHPLWPYIKVIVIGPSISKKDVVPVLDYFNRNNEIQPNPFIVFSEVSAEEIVNLKSHLPALPTLIVEQQIMNQSRLAFAPQVQLFQFNEMMYSPGGLGFASIIRKNRRSDIMVPRIEGMAILKQGRWIGELNIKETRGVLWVKHQVENGILVVSIPGEEGEEETKFSLEILQCNKVKIKPAIKDGEVSATVEVESRLAVTEVLGYFNMNKENLDKLRELAEKEIEQEIKGALKVLQSKYKADVVGFGQAVQRKYPDYWKQNKDDWENIFAEMPVTTNITVCIHKVGLVESVPER